MRETVKFSMHQKVNEWLPLGHGKDMESDHGMDLEGRGKNWALAFKDFGVHFLDHSLPL
jgi:hypothetical protein